MNDYITGRSGKRLLMAALALGALVFATGAYNVRAGADKVTICHAAGLAGTTQYVTITVAGPAAYGPAGHFYENGTPRAGHEQDYLGPCITEDPTSTPSMTPSVAPSTTPSVEPSVTPSVEPSVDPSVEPSLSPSASPRTPSRTVSPTMPPTDTAENETPPIPKGMEAVFALVMAVGILLILSERTRGDHRWDR